MPTKDPSSRPESSRKPRPNSDRDLRAPLDKVYWIRVAFAAAAGVLSGMTMNLLVQPYGGFSIMLAFYLVSVLVGRAAVSGLGVPERQLYTQGIGTYFLLWFMVFSLYVTFFLYTPG